MFIATAVTNFVAGGVSLSTPALGRHLQSSFNGTTAVQAGKFEFSPSSFGSKFFQSSATVAKIYVMIPPMQVFYMEY